MKLRDYLSRQKLTISGFAAEIGEAQPVLSRIVNGKRAPSLRLAQKIHAATAGAVTLLDFDVAPARSSNPDIAA